MSLVSNLKPQFTKVHDMICVSFFLMKSLAYLFRDTFDGPGHIDPMRCSGIDFFLWMLPELSLVDDARWDFC
jgi:hypothetical protein